MSEVTRIACPGCRASLRFEPEALDFPANCTACECRFSVGVYVRISCPRCHLGSKIRESYRGRCVRCSRCRHDFPTDEGIPAGAGGRLLVARRLDTGPNEVVETAQPFLGHAREAFDRNPRPAGIDGVGEAEKLESESLADGRDRLPRRVPGSEAELETARPGLADHRNQPAREVISTGRPIEERGRLELVIQELRAELEAARAEFARYRDQHSNERAATGRIVEEAVDRSRCPEENLSEPIVGRQEVEERVSRLTGEYEGRLRTANNERRVFTTTINRLNHAVNSARSGEFEALRRLEEFARGLAEAEAAMASTVDGERRRRVELYDLVDSLKAEIGTLRGPRSINRPNATQESPNGGNSGKRSAKPCSPSLTKFGSAPNTSRCKPRRK